ncbi:MAG: DUF6748 domain-containing protein [Kofleriaceae bacterium]
MLLGSSLLAACTTTDSGTTPGEDELAGDTGNDGDKADENALQDTFGIYAAQKVGTYECNGLGSCTHVELASAGRSTTLCADGSKAESCSVRYLDFSQVALKASTKTKVDQKLQASAATPEIGAQLMVRGKYVHGTNPTQQGGDWVTFQVTQVWVAQLPDAITEGTFVMVRESGIRCITAPCPSLNENRINSTRNLNIDGIDWPSDISETIQGRIYDATTQRDGVVLAGDRTHGRINGKTTNLRTVNQAFVLAQ